MSRAVDATLIAELFDRHAAALALYAAQWTAEADDCVQEALIELARQAAAPDNPAAWLYRVVRNRAMNSVRAAQRRTTHERTAIEVRELRLREVQSKSGVELADALSNLEPMAREMVVLRIWGGLSWQEIAEVVGGSKSAAQRHYVHALQQLRQLWEFPSTETKSCPNN